MRKLFFILITLTAFLDVSFASFPIADNLEVTQDTIQTEEIKQYHYNLQKMGIDLHSCKCESCRHGYSPLLSKPKILSKKKQIEIPKEKTELNGNLFVLLSVLSALGAIIFFFLTLASGMVPVGNPFTYLILTLVSIGASILSGIIAKKKGANTGKAFLGLGVLGLGVLLFMLLFGV